MSLAIPGYKMGVTITPIDANGALQPNNAFSAQIEDQEVGKDVETDEVTNSTSNGFFEGIPTLVKGTWSITAVLDSITGFGMVFGTQQSNKLFVQVAVTLSKADANPLTYTAKGTMSNLSLAGQVKKAWRVRGKLQVNGDWVQTGAATGAVST